jgi:hypothetical protein
MSSSVTKGRPPASRVCPDCALLPFRACQICCRCEPPSAPGKKNTAGRWCRKCAYKKSKKVLLISSGQLSEAEAPCDCTYKRPCNDHFSVSVDCEHCDLDYSPRACPAHCQCKPSSADHCSRCQLKQRRFSNISRALCKCTCQGSCALCCTCQCGGLAPNCKFCTGVSTLSWSGQSFDPTLDLYQLSCTTLTGPHLTEYFRLYIPSGLRSVTLSFRTPPNCSDLKLLIVGPQVDQPVQYHFSRDDHQESIFRIILSSTEQSFLLGGVYYFQLIRADAKRLLPLQIHISGEAQTGWSSITLSAGQTFEAWKTHEEYRLG